MKFQDRFGDLITVKQLVETILEKQPKTRNNDTDLYFACCRELGAKTLEDAEKIGLSIISVHKLRQKIQNTEGKFQPEVETSKVRQENEERMREYFRS